MCSIEYLPDEILLEILSHCKVEDLALSVRNVNRRWRRLSLDKFLWDDLVLHLTPWLQNNTKEILEVSIHLHALVIYSDIQFVSCFLTRQTPLHTLHLWSSKTPPAEVVRLLTETFPRLRDFGIMFRDCDVMEYLCAFRNLACVEKLSVSYSGRQGGLVRAILLHCPTLVGLNISGCFWLTDDDLLSIVEERGSSLHSLQLDGVLFTTKSLSQLALCTQLRVLHVGSSDMAPDKLYTLSQLPAMRCLELYHAKNIPIDFYKIFFISKSLSNMAELKLFQCRFTDQAASILANNCTKLRTLKLKIISKDSNGSDENLNDYISSFSTKFEYEEKKDCKDFGICTSNELSAEVFTDEGLKRLILGLKHLSVFEVVSENITDRYFGLILKNLRRLLCCRIRGLKNHFSWPPRRLFTT